VTTATYLAPVNLASVTPFHIMPFQIMEGAWIVFAAYWVWAARTRKRVQQRESVVARLLHVAYMACAFVLLSSDDPRLAALNHRFVPDLPWIAVLGAVLTYVGIAFAIWARRHIGRNWSGQVTIRQEHELIRSGPYAHIRHPIYTGLLLAIAGTALVIGQYRALLALAILWSGFTVKAKREEAILARQFGPSFDEHRRHTGFFLPG
jgi:protein-S-isoprenylcysteine O-methyltransferase Ste14